MSECVLETDQARAVVRADRGGMVTAWQVAGREVLYLDADTLADRTKNVRGGIPVLFPSPGKLAGDAWSYRGASGALKQHGFARDLPWRVVATGPAVILELTSTSETRARFPWEFRYVLTYTLRERALRIDQQVENRSSTTMPFGLGFHPYFRVAQADKAAARVETPATRAFDNVTKQTIELRAPIDLTRAEVDLHLVDHGSSECRLALPAGAITIRGSDAYRRWVIWTLAGKDFVCVEPWTCPGNALNTGEGLFELAPGAALSAWLEVSV